MSLYLEITVLIVVVAEIVLDFGSGAATGARPRGHWRLGNHIRVTIIAIRLLRLLRRLLQNKGGRGGNSGK